MNDLELIQTTRSSSLNFEPRRLRPRWGDLAPDRFDGDRQIVLAFLAAGIGELVLDGGDPVVLIRL